jgi:adenylate cyclase
LLLLQRASIAEHDDPLLLTTRCAVHTMAGELDIAEAIIARVLALDPTLAWARERSAWQKAFAGEADVAIEHFRRAMWLDRCSPSSGNRLVGIGSAHFHAGRYDQAAFWMRRALVEQPAVAWAHRTLAVSYARLGHSGSALKSLDSFRRYNPDATIGQVIASVPFPDDFLDRVAQGLNDLGLPP